VALRDGRSGRITEEVFTRIWCATGSEVHLDAHPLLSHIQDQCPTPVEGGLPCITDWLSWREDVELYVLGAYAGLVLGPDAQNLMGARSGSRRAAHVLRHLVVGDEVGGSEGELRASSQKSSRQLARWL